MFGFGLGLRLRRWVFFEVLGGGLGHDLYFCECFSGGVFGVDMVLA